jgi:hypothetical protein
MGSEVTVQVGIDHGQFVACDPDAPLDIDSYGDVAMRQGLAIWGGNGGITVFTASHWTQTEVRVSLSSERPALASADWDHLVEGGLIVRGRHFDTLNEYGDEGDDSYGLLLWPGPPLERSVLKDGFPCRD